jgi:hypothetical protein
MDVILTRLAKIKENVFSIGPYEDVLLNSSVALQSGRLAMRATSPWRRLEYSAWRGCKRNPPIAESVLTATPGFSVARKRDPLYPHRPRQYLGKPPRDTAIVGLTYK